MYIIHFCKYLIERSVTSISVFTRAGTTVFEEYIQIIEKQDTRSGCTSLGEYLAYIMFRLEKLVSLDRWNKQLG
jgi:hypothetical protein